MRVERARSRHDTLLPIVAVLLLAAGVRLLGIANQDLSGDEAFSVMTAIGPVGNLLSALATGEPHPPLYPILLAVWLRGLGRSELVARLPSAFEGIASVAVAAALARRFAPAGDERAATRASVIAALLVALNPFQVWYSQEARMYAQVSFFGGLSSLALVRLWKRAGGSTITYALTVVGVAGTHYFGLFVPLAHGLVVLSRARKDRRLFRAWLSAVVLAALLFAPWVYLARDIFLHYYGAQPGTVDLTSVAVSSLVRLAAGWSVSWRIGVLVAVFLIALATLGAAGKSRSPDDQFVRALLLYWLMTPFVGGYLVSIVRPLYAERYLIVSSLPFILLIARAITRLLASGLSVTGRVNGDAIQSASRSTLAWPAPSIFAAIGGVTLVAVVIVALGPLSNVWEGRYVKSTYNTHARDVAALIRPADAIVLDGTSQRPLYSYYVQQPWPMYPLPRDLPLDAKQTAAELAKISEEHTGVWIFLYATPDYDPGYFVPRWLTQHAYRAFDDWAVSGRLQYYRFAPESSLHPTSTSIAFGDVIGLQEITLPSAEISAGDSIPVGFRWQQLGQTTLRARVSLRLVDQSSFTWAQTDQDIGGDFPQPGDWPEGQLLEDRHALLVPPGTPPGDYHLLLNVYRPGDAQPLTVTGSGASTESGGLLLSTTRVARAADHVWTPGIAGFQPTTATFGETITLLGFAGSDRVTAGESGYLTIIWKALVDHPPLTALHLEVVNDGGSVVEQRDLPLATPAYPSSSWAAGDVLREQYHVPISDQLLPGTYRLQVAPRADTASGTASTPTLLGPLLVLAGAPRAPVKAPEHPLAYELGNAVDLTGFDLTTPPVRSGQPLTIVLHWHDRAPLARDYKVFVHVLDGTEKVVAQRDQQPGAGSRPTSSWFPGDAIVDGYQIDLPGNLPAGAYTVEVGMYNPGDGARLPVTHEGQAAGDRIIISRLDVVP